MTIASRLACRELGRTFISDIQDLVEKIIEHQKIVDDPDPHKGEYATYYAGQAWDKARDKCQASLDAILQELDH